MGKKRERKIGENVGEENMLGENGEEKRYGGTIDLIHARGTI